MSNAFQVLRNCVDREARRRVAGGWRARKKPSKKIQAIYRAPMGAKYRKDR